MKNGKEEKERMVKRRERWGRGGGGGRERDLDREREREWGRGVRIWQELNKLKSLNQI